MTDVEGPLLAFTYAHDAIRTELDHLQQQTAALDVNNPDNITALRGQFNFFETYIEIHDVIEDTSL